MYILCTPGRHVACNTIIDGLLPDKLTKWDKFDEVSNGDAQRHAYCHFFFLNSSLFGFYFLKSKKLEHRSILNCFSKGREFVNVNEAWNLGINVGVERKELESNGCLRKGRKICLR